MWIFWALVLGLVTVEGAVAQGRPNTLNMSCREAQSLVVVRGAIALGTGPYRYERYVRDQSYCPLATVTEQVWEQTADAAQCPVGYRCRDTSEAPDRSGDR